MERALGKGVKFIVDIFQVFYIAKVLNWWPHLSGPQLLQLFNEGFDKHSGF